MNWSREREREREREGDILIRMAECVYVLMFEYVCEREQGGA